MVQAGRLHPALGEKPAGMSEQPTGYYMCVGIWVCLWLPVATHKPAYHKRGTV